MLNPRLLTFSPRSPALDKNLYFVLFEALSKSERYNNALTAAIIRTTFDIDFKYMLFCTVDWLHG